QVNPDDLNTNPKLHAITQSPVPTPTSITSSVPTPSGNVVCPAPTPGSPQGSAEIAEFPIPTSNPPSGSSPQGITAGPDGNLWFTEFDGNRIGRITPGGTITQFPIPVSHIYSFPEVITAGPYGNLWFTENFSKQIGSI